MRAHSIDNESRIIEITTMRGDVFKVSTKELESLLIDRGDLCYECRGDTDLVEGSFDEVNAYKCLCRIKS